MLFLSTSRRLVDVLQQQFFGMQDLFQKPATGPFHCRPRDPALSETAETVLENYVCDDVHNSNYDRSCYLCVSNNSRCFCVTSCSISRRNRQLKSTSRVMSTINTEFEGDWNEFVGSLRRVSSPAGSVLLIGENVA